MRAAAELLGAPAQEILGRDWLDFMRGDGERERARLLLESALASGSSREREFDAVIANGEPRTHLLALHRAPRRRWRAGGLAVLGRGHDRTACAARSTRCWRRTA